MNDFYEFHKNDIDLEFPFRLGIAGAMSSGQCWDEYLILTEYQIYFGQKNGPNTNTI